MSYDLSFRAAAPLARAEVYDWLAQQPHAFPHADRVGFENEATGVYFGFDFHEGRALPDFNLNYVRPHCFGLEAERTLTPFVERFGLEVSDPQMDGMGDGPYSREGFFRGWNAGNRAGYLVMCRDAVERHSLPMSANHMVWSWNYAREETQAVFEDGSLPPAYVPTALVLLDGEGDVATGVAWTGDMPLCFPTGIDWLLMPSDEGTVVLSRSVLLEVLKPALRWSAEQHHIGTPSVVIDAPDEATRQNLLAFAAPKQLSRLPIDEVLDREVLEAVRGGAQ